MEVKMDDDLQEILRKPTDAMIASGAASLGHPNIFMGGPSEQSKRTARRCWDAMVAEMLRETKR